MKRTIFLVSIVALACSTSAMHAQQVADRGAAAARLMENCASLAESADASDTAKDNAKAAGVAADSAYRALIKLEPKNPEPHYGLAAVIARCRIPFAGITTILQLVDESEREAQAALAIAPNHWGARFILAMDYFHLPAMMGKTADATRELETLLAQQGDSAGPPYYARTYRYLGEVYERAGRMADAKRVWARGAALFPADAELKKKIPNAPNAPSAAPVAVPNAAPVASAVMTLPPVTALEPLQVEAQAQQMDGARSGTALRRIDVLLMPGGKTEMTSSLQALPGVTRASEGTDMYVRGGDPAETPVFVDGARIAFAGQWESLDGPAGGVLEASILSKTYFSAGGFSAKYGDALSGVIDVETRGRSDETSWRAGANFAQLGASIFQPTGDRSGAWLTGGVTDTRILTHMNGQSDLYPEAPQSFHLIGGGSFAPKHGVEIRTMGIAMKDMSTRTVSAGSYRGDFASDGTTLHAAVTARALRSDGRVGMHSSVAASQRESSFSLGVLDRARTDRTVNGRTDLEYAGDRTRVRGGIELAAIDATLDGIVPTTPDLAPGSPVLELPSHKDVTSHVGGYIEAEHRPIPALSIVAGVRADRLPGETDVTIDPRLAAGYTAGDWTLRVGGGMYHQGSWRRAYKLPEGGVPAGTPRSATHVVVGAERAGEPSVRIEAYDKSYGSYVASGTGPQITSGNSRGVDMIMRWTRQAHINGWLTYSLLDATVDLANGTHTRAPYDVTHTLTGVARYALTEDWEVGTTVKYATGKPITPIIGSTSSSSGIATPVYGATQSARLPELQRIDARVTRYVRGAKTLAVFYVEMLNLFDHQNVLSYSYDAAWTNRAAVDGFYAHRTIVIGVDLSN